ncbi:PilS cassette [Neisseria meningitidis serogroup B]|uniref:PilS cassette n=1 Tax=Neisseria meningitidis serogroup B TaxID=491 RepID=A0A0H5QVQ2_NEIMI|nr:hypothetical protein CCD83_00440 [Neisseria meningitidis]CRY99708.1 PilS cassette [Neisseria meningitidis serogroup B]
MPSFPRRRESGPVRTETYRAKRFLRFHVLDSRLSGNDEFQDYGVVGTQLNRHSHESGNLESRGLSNCFYPISFCADRSGFPPARE